MGPCTVNARRPTVDSRCCWQAASQVDHTANDGGATTSAIHCWPPSIHRARPHGLELLAGHSRTMNPLDSA